MKTRRRIILFCLAGILLVSGVRLFIQPKPFTYEGKPLDQWLDRYSALYYRNNFSEMQNLNHKLRGLGPSAVPPLIAEMQSSYRMRTSLNQFLSKRNWKYKWAQDLQHNSLIISSRPEAAAQFLYYMGPAAAEAIPALVAAAQQTNLVLRANALNALGSIHQRPETVVPLLIRALTNSWDMNYAVYSLGQFGTNAAAAAPALRTLTGASKLPDVQMAALTALEKVAPDSAAEVAMPIYLRILNDGQNWNRYSVILRLMKLGAQAKEAIPLLIETATKGDDVGQAAAFALKAIDPAAAAKVWPTVPRGEDVDEALMEKQLAREETEEQFAARIRAQGDQKVPYLTKLIRGRPASGNNITEYEQAARALGELGAAAKPAIPDLTQATGDTRWFVRVPAQAALMKIKGENFSPIIAQLKDTSDSEAWYQAAMLAAEFGTNAEPAIPVVIDAMKDGDDIVQGHGAVLLGAIHRQPEICLPVLTALLDSPSVSSRQKAMGALTQFNDDARPVLPQIKAAQSDFDPWVRMLAARVIKKMNPATSKAEAK